MGTTCTAAYVGESDVTIAHVGDSRAYLWRDGDLVAAHARPLAGRRAGGPRQAHRGAGRGAPAALRDHPRARARARRGGRRRGLRRPRRRRLPAVLGRPDVDDPRAGRQARAGADDQPRPDGPRPDRRRQRGRRARQHHGDPVPARGGLERRRGRRRRRDGRGPPRRLGRHDRVRHLRGRGGGAPRQGVSRPSAHTRVRDEEAHALRGGRPRGPRGRRGRGGVPRQRHRGDVGDQAAHAEAEPTRAPSRCPDGTPPEGDAARRAQAQAPPQDPRRGARPPRPAGDGRAARSGSRPAPSTSSAPTRTAATS